MSDYGVGASVWNPSPTKGRSFPIAFHLWSRKPESILSFLHFSVPS